MTDDSTRNDRTGAVAKALGVSNATVQAYARQGRIPCRSTPGNQYRFNIGEVLDVLDRAPLLVREGLGDLLGERLVFADSTTAFRADTMTPDAQRHLRIRGVRPSSPGEAHPMSASDGVKALAKMVRSSKPGVAVAVLHRELVDA